MAVLSKTYGKVLLATGLVITAVLAAGCSASGLWLEKRDNPRDLFYPPEVAAVYAVEAGAEADIDTATELERSDALPAVDAEVLVEFTMAMDTTSTEENLVLQDRAEPPNAIIPDQVVWEEPYLLRIVPPAGGWPTGVEIRLVVDQPASNADETEMTEAFTTIFSAPE